MLLKYPEPVRILTLARRRSDALELVDFREPIPGKPSAPSLRSLGNLALLLNLRI